MKNILLVQSSPRGSESYSQRIADSIVKEVKDCHLSATVIALPGASGVFGVEHY